MRCAWIGVVLAACGGGGATNDAGPAPDAARAPDALQCGLAPPAPVTFGTEGIDVVFDEFVGAYGDPTAVFVDGAELVAFTYGSVIRVALDGTPVSSVPILDEPEGGYVSSVVRGPAGYAARIRAPGINELCILAADETRDPSRCVAVGFGGVLVGDEAGFHIFDAESGLLQRRTYDASAALTASILLEVPDGVVAVVAGHAASDGVHLLAWDQSTPCRRLREHVVELDGDQRLHELFGANATLDSPDVFPPNVAVNETGVSILIDASCLVDGCNDVSTRQPVLFTYEYGALVLDGASPELPLGWSDGDFWGTHGWPRAVARDGIRTVVLGGRSSCNYENEDDWHCSYGLELTRLDVTGAAEGPTFYLPHADLPDQFAIAIAVISASDYAIAYTARDGLRMMRVRLP